MYSLSRYFWVFFLDSSVRLAYIGLPFHVFSRGVFFMGNARIVVVMCISYSLSNRNSVLAIGDLMHACCFNLGRCSDLPYLAIIYLASP